MRRVFTHLTSGWQTGPFVHGGKRFSWKTRIVPLLSRWSNKTTKVLAHTARGSRGISFFSFLLFILLIELFILLLIEFNSSLTFLKDARERGAHDDCQSPLPGQVGPPVSRSIIKRGRSVCDCEIHTYSHDLARPRRTLQEAQNARAKSVKRSEIAKKKSGKLEKPKESRKRQQKDQKNQTIPEK